VSIATASEALNNRGRVAATTRARVQQAADELGYHPDRVARSLRSGRSRLLGLALRMFADEPDSYPADAYFALLISASAAAAMRHGYALALLPDDPDGGLIAQLPVDAMLVADAAEGDPLLDHAFSMGVPVVSDYRPNDPRALLIVDVDREALVSIVFDHLRERGSRRPGLLGLTDDSLFARDVETAYRAWCVRCGVAPHVARAGELDVSAQEQGAMTLWNQGCDAVFGLAGVSGMTLAATAQACGLRVPDDVMIACCAEDLRYTQTDPPLTTVSLDPVAVADASVAMAIDAIEKGVPVEQRIKLVVPRLLARESTRS